MGEKIWAQLLDANPELILYLQEGENEINQQLLELLKGFHVRVVYLHEKDEETVTPQLVTPLSNMRGIKTIEYYIQFERKLTQQQAT